MKKIVFLLASALFISCSNPQLDKSSEQSVPEIISDFLQNPKSLDGLNTKKPIQMFVQAADTASVEKMRFGKTNIEKMLEKAKSYKYCVLITEEHTVVKLGELGDCKTSGSWGACMPMGEGYIKRGELVYQKDYINNIIGLPDKQVRVAYFFN